MSTSRDLSYDVSCLALTSLVRQTTLLLTKGRACLDLMAFTLWKICALCFAMNVLCV